MANFGPQNGLKMAPKFVKKLLNFGSFLGPLFERSWSDSGASWMASWVLLGLSWRSRRPRSGYRLLVLSLPLFRYLEVLMALLGPSWRLLGRSWSQNGPQKRPKSDPQFIQKFAPKKLVKKVTKETRFSINFDTQNEILNRLRRRDTLTGYFGRRYPKTSCFQGCAKMA